MDEDPTFKKLRNMCTNTLISAHDNEAKSVRPPLNYYLVELARRDQSRQTNWIITMTAIVTIATIINVIIAACN